MNRWFWSPVALGLVGGLLFSACASEVSDSSAHYESDAGDDGVEEEVSARVTPDEAQLCAIVFDVSGRADVEGVLGIPDSTRETLDRAILLYTYVDGVTLALHLDADVFRDFSVYGARLPSCWAEAKRKANERPRHNDTADAGVDDANNDI